MGKIALAVFGAALVLGSSIYFRPVREPPRFQGFSVADSAVRLDSRTGQMISCRTGQCSTLLPGISGHE